jgi:hypothetical protein
VLMIYSHRKYPRSLPIGKPFMEMMLELIEIVDVGWFSLLAWSTADQCLGEVHNQLIRPKTFKSKPVEVRKRGLCDSPIFCMFCGLSKQMPEHNLEDCMALMTDWKGAWLRTKEKYWEQRQRLHHNADLNL